MLNALGEGALLSMNSRKQNLTLYCNNDSIAPYSGMSLEGGVDGEHRVNIVAGEYSDKGFVHQDPELERSHEFIFPIRGIGQFTGINECWRKRVR